MVKDRYAVFQFRHGDAPVLVGTFSNLTQAETAAGNDGDFFGIDLEEGIGISPIRR